MNDTSHAAISTEQPPQGQSGYAYVDEDGILTLPEEICKSLGWVEGDELEFIEKENGSFLLVKANETPIDP